MTVGAQVIRAQAAFGVMDAVPCFFFWCGIREAAHVRPPTIGFSGERTPPHAPWVLQFELWRHWFGHWWHLIESGPEVSGLKDSEQTHNPLPTPSEPLKGGLDLFGKSPDSLIISDYLSALGNGSSRPAPPSGEAIEAGGSVKDGYTGCGVLRVDIKVEQVPLLAGLTRGLRA